MSAMGVFCRQRSRADAYGEPSDRQFDRKPLASFLICSLRSDP